MATDFTEYNTLNAVRIVELCLKAGQPLLIAPALLDHRSAESIEAQLATAPATTRAPADDALAAAIERRFRTQNRARGS